MTRLLRLGLGLLGLWASSMYAQPPTFKALPGEGKTLRGAVTNILQDHVGFMWLGTWSGLLRYDGYTFTHYYQQIDSSGLQSNKITAIHEDRAHQLWVGTRRAGLYRFDRANERFEPFGQETSRSSSLSNHNVWSILDDQQGRLWVGTERGLNWYDTATQQFRALFHHPNGLSSDFIYDMCQTEDGSIWMATENGLNRLIWPEGAVAPQIYAYSLGAKEPLSDANPSLDNYLYTLCAAGEQTLWVGSKAGLKRVRWFPNQVDSISVHTVAAKKGASLPLTHDYVTSLLYMPEQATLWVGTFQGLTRIDLAQQTVERMYETQSEPHGLKGNFVRALYLDRTDMMWFGTDGGLSLASTYPQALEAVPLPTTKPALSNTSVSTLAHDLKQELVWVGTFGGGFHCLPQKHFQSGNATWKSYSLHLQREVAEPKLDFVSGIIPDSDGSLWVSSQGGGLVHVPIGSLPPSGGLVADFHTYDTESRPALSDNYVMTLMRDHEANLWLGLWDGGINLFDPQTQETQHFALVDEGRIDLRDYPNVVLSECPVQGDSLLWVGTRGNGVMVLEHDEGLRILKLRKHFSRRADLTHRLSNDFINALLVEDKWIWIGTENGLNRLDRQTGTLSYFLTDGGAGSRIIQGIERGQDGNLWVSTQQGLVSLVLQDTTMAVHVYTGEDGVRNTFFSQQASVSLPDGLLLFGGIGGLSVVDPDKQHVDMQAPNVQLVDLQIFNQSIRPGESYQGRVILPQSIAQTRHVEFSHRDQAISLAFVGLHFDNPDQHQYAYRLEGFDQDWTYVNASQRLAHYTNLPAGDYTFKVKAANGDGKWSDTPAILRMRVLPPPWRSPLAYGGYVLLFGCLLWAVRQVTLMRVNLRNRWQIERLEREKLEAVGQIKQQFFTNVSHELRTPLTLILTPLSQLIETRAGDLSLRDSLQRMHRQAHRLLVLINELLDMRRTEEGKMQLQVAEGNFVKFAREVVSTFDPLAQERDITLRFICDVEDIQIWYDRDQMEKVFFNLLSNALKFTPATGEVSVRLTNVEEESMALMEVVDTGRGIAADQLSHVFERFYQAHSTDGREAQYQGSGIGLALTRSLVEAHHGRIEVQSQKGVGSCFRVYLPWGDTHFSDEEKLTDFQDSEYLPHYVAPQVAPTELPAEAVGTEPLAAWLDGLYPGPPNRPQLLIVEDNDDIRQYLKTVLSHEYDVLEAENGKIGLEVAGARSPDLVITDMAMPEMDGLDLCRRLKTELATSHIPVIMLTARTSLLHQMQGFDTGADAYLTKPFHLSLLQARIRNLIRIRAQLRENLGKGVDLNPKAVSVTSLDQQMMAQLMELMETHMDNSEFSVEQLARELGMSRMQLYRKLKALTGKSPNQVLRTIRLRRAAQLLETGEYNVSEVTYMVGFQDLKYFRERFKEEFGMSPSAYGKEVSEAK